MFKFLGAIIGLIANGFTGLIVGFAIGYVIDRFFPKIVLFLVQNVLVKHLHQVQKTFFETTFTVMGHLAKADGRVSEAEIEMARRIMQRMNLDEATTRQAMLLFGQGKAEGFDLDGALQALVQASRRQPHLLQMFLEIQLTAAYADGKLDPAERTILLRICAALGFSEADFKRLENMIQAELHTRQPGRTTGFSLDDAYAILNISPDASNADVKRAYRRLMSEHHPDKLQAKGLPKEMIKLAEEKTHEIRTAYERIRDARGFK